MGTDEVKEGAVVLETELGKTPPLVKFLRFPSSKIPKIESQGMAWIPLENECLGVGLTQDALQLLTRLPVDFPDKAKALGDLLEKLRNKAEMIKAKHTRLVIIPKDEQSLASDFKKFGENSNLLVTECLPDGRLVVGMLAPEIFVQASAKPLQR